MSEPNVFDPPIEDSNPPADEHRTVDLFAQMATLQAEREKLDAEKAELHDLLLRRTAEFDNFRRRTERERAEFSQYAGMEAVRDFLPVVDDFDRAMQSDHASPEFAKGIELIYQRMQDALKKMGLEPIESVGKPFDPHFHQAIERVPTEEAEDHTILGEYQRGFLFKGKLLRPSMVKVAVR